MQDNVSIERSVNILVQFAGYITTFYKLELIGYNSCALRVDCVAVMENNVYIGDDLLQGRSVLTYVPGCAKKNFEEL
jgi:hypothetical protein